MENIFTAVVALNQTPLDWEGNSARIRQALERAGNAGATVVCLPELAIPGYGCEDMFLAPYLHQRSLEELKELLPFTKGMVVNFGLPLVVRGAILNTVAVAVDGKLVGFVPKQNLARDGVYYEPRWFKAWPAGEQSEVSLLGKTLPVGDLLFDIGGIRIGFEICEDAWVANRPGASLARDGVDLILNPSASHFSFGKREIRRRFVLEGSRAFHAGYLYANLLGCESGRIIFDGDCCIASAGEIVASTPRFSFQDVVVAVGEVDVARSRNQRLSSGAGDSRLESGRKRVVRVKLRSSLALQKRPSSGACESKPAGWEESRELKKEEFTRAVSLGLFDYMRKSRSSGFIVSLSGGVDSSAAACLIRYMLELALSELERAELTRKLGYWKSLPKKGTVEQLMGSLLTCVYQRSENSSATTEKAARGISTEIGATYHAWGIQGLVGSYTKLIEGALERKLSWETDDLALQNVQARVRSPGVWLLANIKGALLLTTSNRSEAAVGYTTMDGDTSGGLSPLGGIDKAFLREWCAWANKSGPHQLQPIRALSRVTASPPTAELRPLERRQTDEGDLMPYVVLDRIERLAIRDRKSPSATLSQLTREIGGQYPPGTLTKWVEKFFRLWAVNQWKRERYAPSFHLDDENLDPKTWCRFPILSSGFEEERAQLLKQSKKSPKR
jgi:NAD+ synthase (glutamine-hydrolysing)